MNALRRYLSTLTPQQKDDYALRAGTTMNYLRKRLSLGGRFGGLLARRLDEASNGAVSRYELRPDIFDPSPTPSETSPRLCDCDKSILSSQNKRDNVQSEAV